MSAKHRWHRIVRRSMLGVATALAIAAGLAPWRAASADKLTPLYTFCLSASCTDGEGPQAGLLRDKSGNLYGTTEDGGAHAYGTVFELTFDTSKKKWKEKVLHNFCSAGNSNHPCTDGANPEAAVIMDESGNLYGTTLGGGAGGNGTVFELVLDPATKAWKEYVIHSFCDPTCPDGYVPSGGLMRDKAGNLYGTTGGGGTHASGTVFELSLDPATKTWKEKVLYSFCPQTGCPDGRVPTGGVIMDKSGNLYGETESGGTCGSFLGCGVVFELTFDTATKTWMDHILYGPDGTQGSSPVGGLIMESGNLYGVTGSGGSHASGTVFEVTLDTTTKKWEAKVIYNFCAESGCANGGSPLAGVIVDKSGNLYGTTVLGGAHAYGTAFELMLDAATKKWHEKVLYSFCSRTNCDDGYRPYAGLIMDGSGNLYGTTYEGGPYTPCFYGSLCGGVFELKP
jgi:uncharacterized repeat protein (TIGR03803 family)